MTEEWRVVTDYPDYEISSLGRVRSWKKGNNGRVVGRRADEPRILRPAQFGNYFGVVLCGGGRMEKRYLHRLVATAFIPNPENKREVNHKDGVKDNNALSNLEWMTLQENRKHASETGLLRSGMDNHMTLYNPEQVLQIRRLAACGLTYKRIAQEVGCSVMQANRIARGLLRKAG